MGDEIEPSLPPPPGVTSNFTDPENIAWIIYATIGATLPFSILTCSLRLCTSKSIIGRWHVDDVLIGISMLLSIGYSVSMCLQAKYTVGRHIWDISRPDGVVGLQIEIIPSAITYNMGLAMTKSSILFFYLRFPSPRAFKAACYLVLFIAVGNGLTAGFAFLYLCQPIEKHWNPYVEGKCADHVLPFWVAAIVNMATDGIILLLPIWLLWPLRLGVAKMLSVLCILMAGGFVCAVTIYRVVDIPRSMKSMDVTWDYTDNYMWCIIETNVAIICACLPCLKAFAKRHFGNTWLFRSSTERSVAQALSFLNTRRPSEAVPGDGREARDGTRRSRRSMAYVELGDHRGGKGPEWGPAGEVAGADMVELSESSSGGVVGGQDTKTRAHGSERV